MLWGLNNFFIHLSPWMLLLLHVSVEFCWMIEERNKSICAADISILSGRERTINCWKE